MIIMIICLCKGISKKTIIEMIEKGMSSEEIVEKLDIGSDCGSCLLDIEELNYNKKYYADTSNQS